MSDSEDRRVPGPIVVLATLAIVVLMGILIWLSFG